MKFLPVPEDYDLPLAQQTFVPPQDEIKVTVVNGNPVVLVKDSFTGQLSMFPVGRHIDTSANGQSKIVLDPQSDRKLTYEDKYNKYKEDPISMLLVGLAIAGLGACITFLFILLNKSPQPFEETVCTPTNFLFWQVGQNCTTRKGYR